MRCNTSLSSAGGSRKQNTKFAFFVALCNKLEVSPSYLLSGVVDKAVDSSIEELVLLCYNAKPSQLKLIKAILKTSLENCE